MSSVLPPPLTYDQLMEMFRQTDQKFQETNRQIKRTNKQLGNISNRLGDLIEEMVGRGVLRLFRKLGYTFSSYSRNYKFSNTKLDVKGEIDLFVENGDTALLVEVKLNLLMEDVMAHIVRLDKFRRFADAKQDKRKFIAAVAGGIVSENVKEFALQNGLYVLVRSGNAMKTIEPLSQPKFW